MQPKWRRGTSMWKSLHFRGMWQTFHRLAQTLQSRHDRLDQSVGKQLKAPWPVQNELCCDGDMTGTTDMSWAINHKKGTGSYGRCNTSHLIFE